jgi:hypothetical protein
MPASVSASTVETTAGVETAAAAACCWRAVEAAAGRTAGEVAAWGDSCTASDEAWASTKARTTDEAGASAESRASVEPAASVPSAATVPGAGADEDASGEPARAVVAVGRAGVRSVVVVTVGADRRGAIIGRADSYGDWTDSYADANLSVGAWCGC